MGIHRGIKSEIEHDSASGIRVIVTVMRTSVLVVALDLSTAFSTVSEYAHWVKPYQSRQMIRGDSHSMADCAGSHNSCSGDWK